MMRGGRGAALAIVVYLGVALWAMRAVLPAPATLLAARSDAIIPRGDQRAVVAIISANARRIVTDPLRLFDGAMCHPAPNSLALGEHMLGDTLLAIPAYWLTGEPIVAMNVVVMLTIVIAGIAMYALVVYWTGSPAAALVGGLVFTLRYERLVDPGHPFVYGNQWTPLVLLFLHRTFDRARWRDAAALTIFACLQLLESVYQVWAFALLVGVYGVWLAIRHVRRLLTVAPMLLASGAVVGGVLVALATPYLRMRATWGILQGRSSGLLYPAEFAFGERGYPGTVALVLAGAALIDRVVRARAHPRDDPRLPLLVAGLCVLWASVAEVRVGSWAVPSLTYFASYVVPGLDALRGLQFARLGFYLVLAFLAGWGVHALSGRTAVARWGLAAFAASAALVETFDVHVAERTFHTPVVLNGYPSRPADDLVALYGRLEDGAVFDYPFGGEDVYLRQQPHYALLGAYHHRRAAACYISFLPPTHEYLVALSARLADPGTLDALHALGFRTLVVHEEELGRSFRATQAVLAQLVAAGRVAPIGRAADHAVYAIRTNAPVVTDPASLAPDDAAGDVVTVAPPTAPIVFTYRNPGPATYRQPGPVLPTRVVVRWLDASGAVVAEDRISRLLPPALGPGSSIAVRMEIPVSVRPGVYDVVVSPESAPGVRVAARRVEVTARHPG